MDEIRSIIESMIRKQRLSWELDDNGVRVGLKRGARAQYVRIDREGRNVVFSSLVLGSREVTRRVTHWRELARQAWYRNCSSELVTFCFDERDRLIGRIQHPADMLDPEEIRIYVECLASECDRFEYLLSGGDDY